MSVHPAPTLEVHLAPDHRRRAMERDVRAGLSGPMKTLPPVWFYDERGSDLFDEITRLPEYHLFRAERAILARWADDIAEASGADTLVELGSGTSEKTSLLLNAMQRRGSLRSFVPFDVSREVLERSAVTIAGSYGVPVHAIVGDFSQHLHHLPRDGKRLVAFLGSTIGNLDPKQRHRFLADLDAAVDRDDRLLLGTDLVTSEARLLKAYDDAAGVTAAFNRNVLAVLNAELDAHFDLDAFAHVAAWDAVEQRIEMRLRSLVAQVVRIDALDLDVTFAEGEDLLTEISSKFNAERVRQELWDGGFIVEQTWTDDAGDFLLTLARPYC